MYNAMEAEICRKMVSNGKSSSLLSSLLLVSADGAAVQLAVV